MKRSKEIIKELITALEDELMEEKEETLEVSPDDALDWSPHHDPKSLPTTKKANRILDMEMGHQPRTY